MNERLIGYFYPVPQITEDERERAGLLITLSIGGVVISSLSFLVALAMRAPLPQLATNFFGLGFCIITLLSLRWWRSIVTSGTIVVAVMTVTHVVGSVATGDLTQVTWVAFSPVLMLLITNARHALFWFIVESVVATATAWWMLTSGRPLVEHTVVGLLIKAFIAGLCIFGFNYLFARSRTRIQQRLEKAHEEATRANALKSQFLASFSHEIRTPLNGVLGTTDLLLSGVLTDEVREQLLVIQRSGSSLLRTINDVLELSRIEAGRLDLFPVATDLKKLLGEVADLFRARATSKGLELTLELEQGHPGTVSVDDVRLRQVLQNLVGNAVKFTSQGSVRVRLWPGEARGELVRTHITVEDTGPGIPPEAVQRLFTAFTQARARTDREEGSGLGLAICKQFVELMGGTLSVTSELGRGTTFTVMLELPRAEPVRDVDVSASLDAETQPLKVLVVDDNEINLRVAASLLMRLGHEVHVARDGEQGLAAIPVHQPDVIFMDCHMPVLDGLDATRRLRAAGDGRPVVALTASVYTEDRERCQAAGMNFFVSKPVTLAALQAALVEVAGVLRPESAKASGAEKRVLVVDDDPHVRRMTVRLLRAEGYDVSDAADLSTAEAIYQRARPAFLVVDNVLGGTEDGLHFADRLRRDHGGLRVVLTSGQRPTDDQLATLKAAGGCFLPKPYSRRALVDLLRV